MTKAPKTSPAPNGAPMAWLLDVALPYKGIECLEWPFSIDADGYGQIYNPGKKTRPHRWICEQVNGPPPSPVHQAAHSCGRGKQGCVSPHHLSWKTPKENSADRWLHGTQVHGESCGTSKIKAEDVLEIRRLAAIGKTHRSIAAKFGITYGNVGKITSGRSWVWLTGGTRV